MELASPALEAGSLTTGWLRVVTVVALEMEGRVGESLFTMTHIHLLTQNI